MIKIIKYCFISIKWHYNFFLNLKENRKINPWHCQIATWGRPRHRLSCKWHIFRSLPWSSLFFRQWECFLPGCNREMIWLVKNSQDSVSSRVLKKNTEPVEITSDLKKNLGLAEITSDLEKKIGLGRVTYLCF